jgi:hypothetical protein
MQPWHGTNRHTVLSLEEWRQAHAGHGPISEEPVDHPSIPIIERRCACGGSHINIDRPETSVVVQYAMNRFYSREAVLRGIVSPIEAA